jgi:hypothetical protein
MGTGITRARMERERGREEGTSARSVGHGMKSQQAGHGIELQQAGHESSVMNFEFNHGACRLSGGARRGL